MNIFILAIVGVSCIAFLIGFLEANKSLKLKSYYGIIHVESVRFSKKFMLIGFIALLADFAMFTFLIN